MLPTGLMTLMRLWIIALRINKQPHQQISSAILYIHINKDGGLYWSKIFMTVSTAARKIARAIWRQRGTVSYAADWPARTIATATGKACAYIMNSYRVGKK